MAREYGDYISDILNAAREAIPWRQMAGIRDDR